MVYSYFYEDILEKMQQNKYYYTDTGYFLNLVIRRKDEEVNKIYWEEILLRAHFTATASLIRNERWLKGIKLGIESNNYMIFTSCLRGFLESTIDSYYSLLNTPFDIAGNFKNIKMAVEGKLEPELLARELEESLIHFQFAKKKNNTGMDFNKALFTSKYIDFFEKYSDIKIKLFYEKLCEVVHPASDSVNCYIKVTKENENFEYVTLNLDLDESRINQILKDYKNQISHLLKMSINAPVICLYVLNLFEYEPISAAYINNFEFYKYITEDTKNHIQNLVDSSFQR